ncbi:acyl-CoA desaturase [Mycobacterium cookii]|uniref:Fatty acid desaturase n=1 Tax=Mycobacterium cookii TaxID=1775 RepID=A0A7I7KWA4_9MYCO|nr:acyl-CoA desaturase [Mycobacterium cookii]MCV7332737.1 acyl-CoA desaturase [Mycobacterium cookii]BBX46104.1 fatty acid desaturase [Mycobacterium cookii]
MTRERVLAAFVVVAPAIALITATALWANGIGPSRTDLIVLAVGTLATMAGVELGYHRYFAHRAFTAAPVLVWLLGGLGSSAFLGPVMWWATTHRRHHSVTDREGDPHSPHWPHGGTRGFVHAHAGWLFHSEYTGMTVTAGEVKDLWQNSRTITLHRTYLVWGALGLAIPTLIGFAAGGARGALTGFLWGGMVRLFLVSHLVWAVNSFGHLLGGPARLAHSGQARNSVWLALPAFGGGNHANHHDAPRVYTTRVRWWQIDIGGMLLRGLSMLGLVSDLKRPVSKVSSD